MRKLENIVFAISMLVLVGGVLFAAWWFENVFPVWIVATMLGG